MDARNLEVKVTIEVLVKKGRRRELVCKRQLPLYFLDVERLILGTQVRQALAELNESMQRKYPVYKEGEV